MESLRPSRPILTCLLGIGVVSLCLLAVSAQSAGSPAPAPIIQAPALDNLLAVSISAIEPDTNTETTPAVHAALRSDVAFVQNMKTSAVLYEKNADKVQPIASISKLMTALLIVQSGLPMDEVLEITSDDIDRLRHSRSRLRVGSRLDRSTMLHLALMSSENRAAHALARTWPGGEVAFVRAMNDQARALGMRHTTFVEPTGLSSDNVSSPRDLVKLLRASSHEPLIHQFTTDDRETVDIGQGRTLRYLNSNRLVRRGDWDIRISKTGFINEAGECLVMLARIGRQDLAIILLDSQGRYSRVKDAVQVRSLIKKHPALAMM
ncbi:MAG: D-alanyl-D-alanine endopeptidase [Alcaligenaceae bacterium]|nr:D-alanyl-D-alanine endopeptidase [Alcaligenaceae bacterium]